MTIEPQGPQGFVGGDGVAQHDQRKAAAHDALKESDSFIIVAMQNNGIGRYIVSSYASKAALRAMFHLAAEIVSSSIEQIEEEGDDH